MQLPPLHPRCRCAIDYREVEKPQAKPLTSPQGTGNVGGKPSNETAPNSNPTGTNPTATTTRSLRNIGAKHYAVVQVILANAPNPKSARVWEKFEDKMQIGSTNITGTAYHQKGVLYLDIDQAASGDVISKPYQTLFHEGAHAIDFINAENGEYFSERYENGAFLRAIVTDIEALIESEKAALQTQSEEEAHRSLCRRLKKEYSVADRANLSDLLSGYTNDKYNLGTGHKSDYWTKGGDVIKSREGFADFMDSSIGNLSAYKVLAKHLPTASKVFEDMLDELLKQRE